MTESISGINVKIGADLTDLKKKLGEVGDTVEKDIAPAKDTTKELNENFKNSATNAAKTAISAAAVAVALGKIGKSLLGFSKGILEDALKVNPETKEKVDAVATAFDNMKIALGESLFPLIEQFAPKLTTALDAVTGWIKENPEAAQNIMLVVGALGAMTTAASAAVPVLMLFNLSIAPISGTAIAVATAIGGLVMIIGMLIAKSDELTEHTAATSESIESMDTASQSLVQNGFGELEIWDKQLITREDGVTGYYSDVMGWDGLPMFIEVQQDVADALSVTTSAVEEQATAMETTQTTAEEVNEILSSMQTTMEGIGETASGGLTDSMTQINEILESEAFQQLTNQPVSEDVVTSYQNLAEAVMNTGNALGGEESGMTAALTGLPALFDQTRVAAESLAGYLSGGFVAAIGAMMTAVCLTSTNEEGNLNAGGGNTLYNALGSVYGLFLDILATSQLLAGYWSTAFISASEAMRTEAGEATGVVQGLADAAYNTALAFYDVVDAYLAMIRATSGGGGGGGRPTGGSNRIDAPMASGGTVRAGGTYLVGELGPEIFMPHTGGTIIPNNEIGTGPAITVNFNGDVIGDERSISAYVTKAANKALREAVYAAG